MNNQQFRRLVLDTPARQQNGAGSPPKSASPPATSLGSRARSSIPMTPRTIKGSSVHADFARQLSERDAQNRPARKFRSAAPKGSKLATGYRDRTQNRDDDEEEGDEKSSRIKALEESMKLGQIDRDTFERLVEEITGGEIGSTHLVKGLDRKLLERIRKGEDVLSGASKQEALDEDIENEFERFAESDVAPIMRENAEKKGEMAPPVAKGLKRNRDAIIAELKAQRKAAAEAAEAERQAKYPSLGAGFRKIGEGRESSRMEIDERGREVLILTDAEGNEKRKVRKSKGDQSLDLPDNSKPLDFGLKVPDVPVLAVEEEEDQDIFEGVGSNYNPLAALEMESEDSSDGEESEDGEVAPFSKTKPSLDHLEAGEKSPLTSNSDQPSSATGGQVHIPPPTLPRRNYFLDNLHKVSINPSDKSVADATVMAALRKVQSIDPESSLLQNEEETRLKKRAAELAAQDRDLDDLDVGFGSSRFDDVEEMEEGERIKLAEWKGIGATDNKNGGRGERSENKRKRGPKKRKGDKNSATDVLKVMERNKDKRSLG